jgi:hypothetical protein
MKKRDETWTNDGRENGGEYGRVMARAVPRP